MKDLLNFLAQSLQSIYHKIDEFATVFLAGLFFLSAYYWINIKLSGIIRSTFWRRNIVALLLVSLFTTYYVISLSWQNIDLKQYMQTYFIEVVFFFACLNLYFLLTYHFAKHCQQSLPQLKYFTMFLLVCLTIIGSNWFLIVLENSTHNYTDDILTQRWLSFQRSFPICIIDALLITTLDAACRYVIRLQESREKIKELETLKIKEQLTKAQLDALHAKVNPHFLYNSLNSIAGLALTDGQKTQQMAVSLSKFFRYSINHKEDNLVTVGEELEMVETYLKIEEIRFEERLNFEIINAPETEEIKIPRFILQPLVENSVKHGMKGKEGNLFIRIQAQMEGKKLSLSVEDDGEPFGDDLKPGYGLKSIYDKLDILFPEKYEVALYNEPVKRVRILIET